MLPIDPTGTCLIDISYTSELVQLVSDLLSSVAVLYGMPGFMGRCSDNSKHMKLNASVQNMETILVHTDSIHETIVFLGFF